MYLGSCQCCRCFVYFTSFVIFICNLLILFVSVYVRVSEKDISIITVGVYCITDPSDKTENLQSCT